MVVVEYEQLTLEPAEPRKPLPLPFLTCPGCAERDPATDPPCPVCGVDVVDGVRIPL
jgi:hypothetical protein